MSSNVSPHISNGNAPGLRGWFPPALALLLFLVPLIPDFQIVRPKLLALETGIYGLGLAWLAASFASETIRFRRLVCFWPAALYGAAVVLYHLFSADRTVAFAEFNRGLLSLAGYLVAAQIIYTARSRTELLTAWLAGSFLAVLYGLLQYADVAGIVGISRMDRVMSTFGNPIFFAAHLVVTLPLAAAVLTTEKKAATRLLTVALLAAGIVALYLSRTRAAYIGLGVAACVFIAFYRREIAAKYRAAAIAVIVVAGIAASHGIWARQQEHLLIWRDTLRMWSASPWTGTGSGTFHLYFPRFASAELKRVWPQKDFIVNDAHNEYLQYLSETGIAGLGVFLFFVTGIVTMTVRRLRSAEDSDRPVLAGILAAMSGLLAQNFFSADMRFTVSAAYLFILAGLAEGFSGHTVEERSAGGPVRAAGIAASAGAALLLFPPLYRPAMAQRAVAAAPDFFSEKVLDAARSIGDLQAIAARYPDRASVYEKLGWVYAKEQQFPEAIASYERAVALDPALPGPWNNLGNIYFLRNDKARAIECWTRSLAIAPDQIDSRLNLATACFHEGRLKEASDHLRQVLRRDPSNAQAIVLLKRMKE